MPRATVITGSDLRAGEALGRVRPLAARRVTDEYTRDLMEASVGFRRVAA